MALRVAGEDIQNFIVNCVHTVVLSMVTKIFFKKPGTIPAPRYLPLENKTMNRVLNGLTSPCNPQLVKKIRTRPSSDSNDTGTDYFLSETGSIFRSAVSFGIKATISAYCIGTQELQTVSFVSEHINETVTKKMSNRIDHNQVGSKKLKERVTLLSKSLV